MILFSPIGATDPLRDFRDGALLHIVRHYKERGLWKVVLFYTDDMRKITLAYDPYKRSIKKIAPEMEIEEIPTFITEPQLFDAFIDIFPKTIYDLHEKYPDEKIILNISSGTPQMQSTLAILAVECDYTLAVQVNTPRRAANRDLKFMKTEADFVEMFNKMADDDPTAENRCIEPALRLIRKHSDKGKICKLIERYDYDAALTIAKENNDIPADVKSLLEHAAYRMKLQPKDACKVINEYNDKKLCPLTGSRRTLMEYFLTIDADQKTGNLFGVLIKSIPFLYELLLNFVKRDDEIKLISLYIENGTKDFILRRDLLQANNPKLLAFLDKKFGGFHNTKLSTTNLTYICEFAAVNSTEADLRNRYEQICSIINYMTSKDVILLRNDVAHIITDMDEEKFQKLTGLESKKLVEYFFELLVLVYKESITPQKDFYDNLNKIIRSAMEK